MAETQENSSNGVKTGVIALAGLVVLGGGLMTTLGEGDVVADTAAAVTGSVSDAVATEMKAGAADGFVVIDGQTWVAVDGAPVALTVLNDDTCGTPCDTTASIALLKQNISPALIINEIDISSREGEAMAATHNVMTVPAYFVGSTVTETALYKQAGAQVFQPAGDQFLINGAPLKLPRGQFIATPEFDFDGTNQKGDGPVQLVEFFAFECGYCRKFYVENKDTIDQLVADGRITYTSMHFPLWGDTNHLAAECFAEQGKWWEAHDAMFADNSWTKTPDAFFAGLIADLGIDQGKYDACIANPETKARIKAQQDQGRKYGVTGTPALFIGDQFMPGAISPERLVSAIEAAE